MLTVLEAIKLSSDYLEKKGIESPRLNAEILLAEILSCKRLDLYLSFERPLKENEIINYREWIARRGKYEPLQYIVGKIDFYGSTLIVNPSVLIPRPETEILVENIIKENKTHDKLDILDIGVGSGNISISLAKHLPNSQIVCCDVSTDAIVTAKKNAEMNGVEKQLSFFHEDIYNHHQENNSFDIIVSNPPYVSEIEFQTLQKEIIEYEPKFAITDEEDGFKFYKFIVQKAMLWLKNEGKLYFEVGKGQAEKIKTMMEEAGLTNIKTIKDYQQIDRVISGEKV